MTQDTAFSYARYFVALIWVFAVVAVVAGVIL